MVSIAVNGLIALGLFMVARVIWKRAGNVFVELFAAALCALGIFFLMAAVLNLLAALALG